MGDLDAPGVSSTLRVIISVPVLATMLPTLDRRCEEKTTCLKWNWPLVDYGSGTPEAGKKRSVSR